MKNLLTFILIVTIFNCTKPSKKEVSREPDIENIKEESIKSSLELNDTRENFKIDISTTYEGLLSNVVKEIELDENKIWLCYNNGIGYIDKNSGKIQNIYETNYLEFTTFKKVDNNFILGSVSGLFKLNINNKNLSSIISNTHIIPYIIELKETILCCDVNGNIYKIKNGNIVKITNSGFNNAVVLKKFDNLPYLLTKDGIYKIDISQSKIIRIINFTNANDFVIYNEDLYLASNSLLKYASSKFQTLLEFSERISINFLLLSKENDSIYIGTTEGLGIYKIKEAKYYSLFSKHKVKDADINYIIEDDEKLWVATKNYGLIKYAVSQM